LINYFFRLQNKLSEIKHFSNLRKKSNEISFLVASDYDFRYIYNIVLFEKLGRRA